MSRTSDYDSSISRANSFTGQAESSRCLFFWNNCRFPRPCLTAAVIFPHTKWLPKNHRLSWHCRFNKHLFVQWRVRGGDRSLIHHGQECTCKYAHAHGNSMHTFSKKIIDFGEKWPGRATGNRDFFWLGLMIPWMTLLILRGYNHFANQQRFPLQHKWCTAEKSRQSNVWGVVILPHLTTTYANLWQWSGNNS